MAVANCPARRLSNCAAENPVVLMLAMLLAAISSALVWAFSALHAA
jgi:hypothetical protein